MNKITIIVPAYQTQDYIEECLDSIENQTFFKNFNNYEILVGIDGCEKTLNKLLEIRHKYRNLRIFMMKENKGLFVTLNTLHEIVNNSEIILKFDSDDIMMPNLIERILKYVNMYDIIRFKSLNFNNNNIKKTIQGIVPHGVFLMKKNVYDYVGGYRDWVCGADTDFHYRLVGSKFKEFIINDNLFYRRIHENSLTQNPKTNKNSKIRKNYINKLKKGFVKIKPKINSYVEI